jgi:phosphoribosylanthranilate isomerase
MPPPRIKICCIADPEEAALAISLGADCLGLVSEMPSGPGPIAEEQIAVIAARIPPGVSSFLLTSRTDPGAIIAQQRRTGVDTLQFCDRVSPSAHHHMRQALPGVKLVQVVHVTSPASVEEALGVAPHVHALLLDSGNQELEVKELGGTGRVHDWQLSREIRERVAVPVFLAGGLRPENAAAAIAAVEPYGLDVCTGVRTEGKLDATKLDRFIRAVSARGRTAG